METNKEAIQRILDRLPDDAPLENILFYLIQESQKILEAQTGVKRPVLTPEQIKFLEQDLAR